MQVDNERQTKITPALLDATKAELISFQRAAQKVKRAAETARLIMLRSIAECLQRMPLSKSC